MSVAGRLIIAGGVVVFACDSDIAMVPLLKAIQLDHIGWCGGGEGGRRAMTSCIRPILETIDTLSQPQPRVTASRDEDLFS